jgi:predicted transcriptional regulator
MGMVTAKQKILQALDQLPDDTSVEEAIERLCFIAKVEEGLRQADQGDILTHQEAKQRLTT